MGQAVRLYRAAGRCLGGTLGAHQAGRLVLSMFFKAVLGIQRVFHFETLDDLGVAILTGGTTVLSRTALGSLLRAVPLAGVQRLVQQTRSKLERTKEVAVSLDEHTIARFTRKFTIAKAYHTVRNKKMKAEQLFFAFALSSRKLLTVVATAGDAALAVVARELLPTLRRRARGALLRVVADAGAAKDYEALMELVAHRRQVTIVRVPRRPAYRKAWAAIPESRWRRIEEAGPYVGAPPKVVHLAETLTDLRVDCADGTSFWEARVRTVVVREEGRQGKDRWHALWVFGDERTPGWDVVQEFRQRQHHEQRYRVLVHDAFVDTAPSGYDKGSDDPEHPRFDEGALTCAGWIAAVVTNAIEDLTERLPENYRHAHLRTVRRWLFDVPGEIYLGEGTMIVLLAPRRLRGAWQELIQWTNRRRLRIPWLENRRLILSLEPPARPRRLEVSSAPNGGA